MFIMKKKSKRFLTISLHVCVSLDSLKGNYFFTQHLNSRFCLLNVLLLKVTDTNMNARRQDKRGMFNL